MTVLIAAGFVVAVCWRISLRFWPYARCGRCEGSGRNAGSNRQRWGFCRKCGGSGRRERVGVRFFYGKDR